MNAYQTSKERTKARNQVIAAERRVTELEERLGQIEASLSSPAATDNVIALSQEHGGVQLALSEAMEAWERASAYVEALG